MNDDRDPVTLWSDTLLDLLCDAVCKGKADPEVRRMIRDLRALGMKADHILKEVRRPCGERDAVRVGAYFKPGAHANANPP